MRMAALTAVPTERLHAPTPPRRDGDVLARPMALRTARQRAEQRCSPSPLGSQGAGRQDGILTTPTRSLSQWSLMGDRHGTYPVLTRPYYRARVAHRRVRRLERRG